MWESRLIVGAQLERVSLTARCKSHHIISRQITYQLVHATTCYNPNANDEYDEDGICLSQCVSLTQFLLAWPNFCLRVPNFMQDLICIACPNLCAWPNFYCKRFLVHWPNFITCPNVYVLWPNFDCLSQFLCMAQFCCMSQFTLI